MEKANQGLAPAESVSLISLVDYATDSVVSRTLVKNGGGTLTVFAFSAGQELSEHSAPFDAVVQVLDGVATIIIDGKPHTVPAGNTILMPADVPHAVKAEQQFKMQLIMIRG